MYSSFSKLCTDNNEILSASKFLQPNSSIYYNFKQPVILTPGLPDNVNNELSVRDIIHAVQRPTDIKTFDPTADEIRENYPVNCELCRRGKDIGTAWYGPSDIQINRDIQQNPKICNANQHESVGHFQKSQTKFLPGVGGEIRENFHQNLNNAKQLLSSKSAWGPRCWELLHAITFSYPQKPSQATQRAALNFFNSLPLLLPCIECGEHCKQKIKENPPDVRSRDTLSRWCVNLHNEVNKMLRKSAMSYDTAKGIYNNKNSCSNH